MTPCPAIVRSALPAVLLAALCAWAEPNGHLERVKAMLELQAELEPPTAKILLTQPALLCDILHVMANRTTRIMLFAALVAPFAASAQTNAPALSYVVSNAYVEIRMRW